MRALQAEVKSFVYQKRMTVASAIVTKILESLIERMSLLVTPEKQQAAP